MAEEKQIVTSKELHEQFMSQPDSIWDYYHGKIRCFRRKIQNLNAQSSQINRSSVLNIIDDLFQEVDFDRKVIVEREVRGEKIE
jgi:hypothetical protein